MLQAGLQIGQLYGVIDSKAELIQDCLVDVSGEDGNFNASIVHPRKMTITKEGILSKVYIVIGEIHADINFVGTPYKVDKYSKLEINFHAN